MDRGAWWALVCKELDMTEATQHTRSDNSRSLNFTCSQVWAFTMVKNDVETGQIHLSFYFSEYNFKPSRRNMVVSPMSQQEPFQHHLKVSSMKMAFSYTWFMLEPSIYGRTSSMTNTQWIFLKLLRLWKAGCVGGTLQGIGNIGKVNPGSTTSASTRQEKK